MLRRVLRLIVDQPIIWVLSLVLIAQPSSEQGFLPATLVVFLVSRRGQLTACATVDVPRV